MALSGFACCQVSSFLGGQRQDGKVLDLWRITEFLGLQDSLAFFVALNIADAVNKELLRRLNSNQGNSRYFMLSRFENLDAYVSMLNLGTLLVREPQFVQEVLRLTGWLLSGCRGQQQYAYQQQGYTA